MSSATITLRLELEGAIVTFYADGRVKLEGRGAGSTGSLILLGKEAERIFAIAALMERSR